MNRREFIRNGVVVLLTTQLGLGMLRSVDEPFRMTATEVNRSMREHWDRVCNPPLVFDAREHLINEYADRLSEILWRHIKA